MKRLVVAFASAFVLATPMAAAQNLTADDVANAYVEAVTLCARAKLAGGGIAQLGDADRARVDEAAEPMREMSRAPEGRPVWDVLAARGIVVISEPTDAQCEVMAYGPRVRPVFERTAAVLTASEFGFAEVSVEPDPSSILRGFERIDGERRIHVMLDGGEPGMPGRTFRFPMLMAFVRAN